MSESYYRRRLMSEFQRLVNESKDASLISHPVLKGNIREQGLGRLIAQILPDGWDIGKGQIHDSFGNQSGEIDLIIYNADFISSRWTSNQCKIVLLALQNMDQRAIASKLRITQQAVSKQIDSAGWAIVSESIAYFKNAILNTSIAGNNKK